MSGPAAQTSRLPVDSVTCPLCTRPIVVRHQQFRAVIGGRVCPDFTALRTAVSIHARTGCARR